MFGISTDKSGTLKFNQNFGYSDYTNLGVGINIYLSMQVSTISHNVREFSG